MRSFLPLLLVLISLASIIIIVIRKYPQLTVLDVESIVEVKQQKKKNDLWRRKAEKQAAATHAQWKKIWWPIYQKCKQIQLLFRQYVGKVEREFIHEREKKKRRIPVHQLEKQGEELRQLLQEGFFALEHGELETAEGKFIAVIRIDPKNIDAYRGLGDVYYRLEQFTEANETYTFLLHLDSNNDQVYVRLADIAERQGNIIAAIEFYQQAVLINDNLPTRFAKLADLLVSTRHYETALEAVRQAVELEPQNPKYLDSLVEVSIMAGNKILAEDAWKALRKVNPENQKLELFREKIDRL